MHLRFIALPLLLLAASAFGQTPIAEMPNPVPICSESQACVITAISDPNAKFQFGSGTTWCQTFNTPKTFPFTVTSLSPVCPYDPAPSTDKTLAAQQRNTTYYVTYTLNGTVQPVKTVIGLLVIVPPVVPPPTVIMTLNCVINIYSDGTYKSLNCSAVNK